MSLLNKTSVRQYALDCIRQERPALADKFTRVGSEFFDAVEAAARSAIVARIKSHNSAGKTLR